jgi:tetratricopeptide (TPR) repeat protein
MTANFLRQRCLETIVFICLIGTLPGQAATSPTPQPTPAQTPQKKPPQPDQFPPSPLELTAPDPLLPGGLQRPLSESERLTLGTALDDLNAKAIAKYRSGDILNAFEIWNRELRLRRALGFLNEVTALGRVGDSAWKQNQPNEVNLITRRLQAIQKQVQTPTTNRMNLSERPQIMQALGTAYQLVRSPGLAVAIYEQLLSEARQRKDAAEEVSLLNTIGQLHLSWFDYSNAAATYTELLKLAQTSSDRASQAFYLTQLAYGYEQAKQPAQAVQYQQQLTDLYQKNPQPELLPALKIKIADNYAASGQVNLAEQNYQEAFKLAQPVFQLAYASDALQKLGALYRSHDRLDAALQVYEYLAGVQQQTYDTYGLMEAYDQIGQIHLARKAYPQALTAFNQGLVAAKQLNYRTDYFTSQIQQVSQKTGRSLQPRMP